MAIQSKALRKAPLRNSKKGPDLSVVKPPATQRVRVPFLAICLMILGGAMLGALVLNTSMASTAYVMHSTKLELARTQQYNDEQAEQVDRLSSPSRLAEKAESLGMVPQEGVTYIDLENGALIGKAGKNAKDS